MASDGRGREAAIGGARTTARLGLAGVRALRRGRLGGAVPTPDAGVAFGYVTSQMGP